MAEVAMQRVSVVVRVPGRPDKEFTVAAADARERHAARLANPAPVEEEASAAAPDPKRQKLDVASSVADRAGGPGTDPTSRFAYVYTGKHDHGALEDERSRVVSAKWSGMSSALSETKLQTDAYLTSVIESK